MVCALALSPLEYTHREQCTGADGNGCRCTRAEINFLGLLCLPTAPVLPVYDDERKPRHVFAFWGASDKLLLACQGLHGDAGDKAQASGSDPTTILRMKSRRAHSAVLRKKC